MSVESARPGRGWSRSTNVPLNGSPVVADNGSGGAPFTRRRSSERKRVSRKNSPCASPGTMSPLCAEMQNAEPSTSVSAAPSPPNDALTLLVHGVGTVPHATPGRDAVPGVGEYRGRVRIAQIAPVWFTVPPRGYGGIELVVSLLADGLADRGHDVTLFASGGSQTKAELVSAMEEPPDAALLGNVWFDAYHALSSYLHTAEFDVVHDHSGIIGPALGALLGGTPPVVHTLHGPWSEPSRRYYALLHERVHLVAISAAQRADNPSIRYAGTAQRDRSRRVPVARREGRLPRLHRARQPREGADRRDRGRPARRPAPRDDREAQRAVRARVLGRDGRARAERRGRGVRAPQPRGEDRPAVACPGDGLPHPVARAVRARDGGGHGVRHARGRVPGRRGRRAGRGGRDGVPPRLDRRPRRRGRPGPGMLTRGVPRAGGPSLLGRGDGGGL